MAYFFLSILCFVLIHVQSVKVIQNKDGNLVLKGITNWEQIIREYTNNKKDSSTAIGGGVNHYDGGDIIVYHEDSGKATNIVFKINGKPTPYHYLHQNLHDCSFEFICVAWWTCLRGFSTMNLLPDVLIHKIRHREISFAPQIGIVINGISPITAFSGFSLNKKIINWETNLVFYNFDRRELKKDSNVVLRMKDYDKAVFRVKDFWINIGSDNKENAKFVVYRGGHDAHFGKNKKMPGLWLHETENKNEGFSISFSDLATLCEERKVAVGMNHDIFIHSYDGDYGLKASDHCVPYSDTEELPPATAPDFELLAVKEGDEESHKLPPPIPVPLESASVYNHKSAHNQLPPATAPDFEVHAVKEGDEGLGKLPPPIPAPLERAVVSAHSAYYDEYDDYLEEIYDELEDELEQFERSKAYRAGFDKGFNDETKRMNRLKYRLNQ